MKIKLCLISCFFFISVSCQEPQNNEGCHSQTINIYANNVSSVYRHQDQQTGKVIQERKGEIGPRGYKGDKGIQGEPGIPNNTLVDPLRRELTELKNKFDEVTNDLAMAKRKIDVLFPQSTLSCDYINGTSQESGMYLINPDPTRLRPFYVYCGFSGNTTETIINHDSLNEVRFSGCDPAFCYKRKVIYNAALPQIVSLISTSMNCRQFIKLRCIGVMINDGGGIRYASWISRNGNRESYWGGATSERDGYCACGETGTCDNRSKKCNCDSNDATERSDEGFLTNKNKLPVIELQFGDNSVYNGNNEVGWHALGPLICSGRS